MKFNTAGFPHIRARAIILTFLKGISVMPEKTSGIPGLHRPAPDDRSQFVAGFADPADGEVGIMPRS